MFGLSIIKHVTLQKIVAHDFRYDPRTCYEIVVSPKLNAVFLQLVHHFEDYTTPFKIKF